MSSDGRSPALPDVAEDVQREGARVAAVVPAGGAVPGDVVVRDDRGDPLRPELTICRIVAPAGPGRDRLLVRVAVDGDGLGVVGAILRRATRHRDARLADRDRPDRAGGTCRAGG